MKGSRVSHYRLTERLGRGTYGEVWKGVHVDDADFTVAVKLVSPAVRDDPAFVSALRRECKALDRMDHPNIVRFRELVVRDGVVAMVLELLEGSDLEGLIGAGPQPVDEVVRVLEASLEGLAYAHARGVVHRDIKPGNLFRCDDGRVKLMDFGIARAADGTRATQTGTLQGTIDYMAPERFSNQSGPSSDVYAMGLVAWELLAGRRACPEGDLAAKLGWHLGVGLTDARSVRPDCPGWLAEVVSSLGSKEAGTRPADGGAALALLRSRQSAGSSGAVVVLWGMPTTFTSMLPWTPSPWTERLALPLMRPRGASAATAEMGSRMVRLSGLITKLWSAPGSRVQSVSHAPSPSSPASRG